MTASLQRYLALLDLARKAFEAGDWRTGLRLEFQADTVRELLYQRQLHRCGSANES